MVDYNHYRIPRCFACIAPHPAIWKERSGPGCKLRWWCTAVLDIRQGVLWCTAILDLQHWCFMWQARNSSLRQDQSRRRRSPSSQSHNCYNKCCNNPRCLIPPSALKWSFLISTVGEIFFVIRMRICRRRCSRSSKCSKIWKWKLSSRSDCAEDFAESDVISASTAWVAFSSLGTLFRQPSELL